MKKLRSLLYSTPLLLMMFISQSQAFNYAPGFASHSLMFDYATAAQLQGSSDIQYPLCIRASEANKALLDQITTDHIDYRIETYTYIANDWNDLAEEYIPDFPVSNISFYYIGSYVDSCPSLADGLEPLVIELRSSGVNVAGDHLQKVRIEAFLGEGIGISFLPHDNNIFLHEFGHALGLADDYKGSSVQGGRPPSMMKMNLELQPEDGVALKFLWDNRNDLTNAECPESHFMIDEFLRTAVVPLGTKSCLPYVKHEVTNAIGDDCIAFFDDDERDERIREQNPENYFRDMIGEPICIGDTVTSLVLPFSENDMPDSIWVGDDIHAQVRGLALEDGSDRYLTLTDTHVYHPYAWFHNPLADKGLYEDLTITALAVTIAPRETPITHLNIPLVDEDQSKTWSADRWLADIEQLPKSAPGDSCRQLLARDSSLQDKSGVYRISLDRYSDHEVYCDMETDGGGWTYIGYLTGEGRTGPFFFTKLGVYQLDPTHAKDPATGLSWEDCNGTDCSLFKETIDYLDYNTRSYSSGIAPYLNDNEMMIRVHDYETGPTLFMQYEEDFQLFNEGDNCPDSSILQTILIKEEGDAGYSPGSVQCNSYLPSYQTVVFKKNGNVLFTNAHKFAHGVGLRDEVFQNANPTRTYPVTERGYQGWYFVRKKPEDEFEKLWENGGCNQYYTANLGAVASHTVAACAEACRDNQNCESFTYPSKDAPDGYKICTLYDQICTPTTDIKWDHYKLTR